MSAVFYMNLSINPLVKLGEGQRKRRAKTGEQTGNVNSVNFHAGDKECVLFLVNAYWSIN